MSNNDWHINQAEYIANGHEDSKNHIVKGIEEMRNNGVHREGMIVDDGQQVIDVVDLINNSGCSAIAIRLKTLLENGITEEMIESKYIEISSGITDISAALDNMRSVCDMLIQYLTDIPNGIVIDPVTGEVDVEGSIKSAVEIGILTENDVLVVNPLAQAFGIEKYNDMYDIFESKILSSKDKQNILKLYEKKYDYNLDFYDIHQNSFSNRHVYSKEHQEEQQKVFDKANLDEDDRERVRRTTEDATFDSEKDGYLMQKLLEITYSGRNFSDEKLLQLLEKQSDSKFYKEILDENGKINREKIKETADWWILDINEHTLTQSLTEYIALSEKRNGIDLNNLDEYNKKYLSITLARGYYAEQPEIRKLFQQLCKENGIDSSLESILKITGSRNEEELKKLKEAGEVTKDKQSFRTKIHEMINESRMSELDYIIYNAFETVNIGTNGNRYSKPERAEVVARAYYEYYKKSQGKPSNDINVKIAESIKMYMKRNPKYFSEYFSVIKSEHSDTYQAENKFKINLAKLEEMDKEKTSPAVSTVLNLKLKQIEKQIDYDNRIKDNDKAFMDFIDRKSVDMEVEQPKVEQARNIFRDVAGIIVNYPREVAKYWKDKITGNKENNSSSETVTASNNTESNSSAVGNGIEKKDKKTSIFQRITQNLKGIFKKDDIKMLNSGEEQEDKNDLGEDKNQTGVKTERKSMQDEIYVGPIMPTNNLSNANNKTTSQMQTSKEDEEPEI